MAWTDGGTYLGPGASWDAATQYSYILVHPGSISIGDDGLHGWSAYWFPQAAAAAQVIAQQALLDPLVESARRSFPRAMTITVVRRSVPVQIAVDGETYQQTDSGSWANVRQLLAASSAAVAGQLAAGATTASVTAAEHAQLAESIAVTPAIMPQRAAVPGPRTLGVEDKSFGFPSGAQPVMAAQVLSWPTQLPEWTGFLDRWGLVPEVAVAALALGHYVRQLTGRELVITSGTRTKAKQADLLAQWKAGRPGVFKPATNSAHLQGLAFDATYADGSYPDAPVGQIAGLLGLRWGGSFSTPDPVHFDTGSVA